MDLKSEKKFLTKFHKMIKKSDDGFTVLLNVFDKHLAKDDLSDSLEKN